MAANFQYTLLFGISGGEILVIMLLVLLLFGPKKIPEIARMLGRGINEFKKVQREINSEINRYSSEVENQAREIQSDIDNLNKEKLTEKQEVSQKQEQPLTDGTANDEKPEENKPNDDDLPYPYNQKTGDS